MHRVLVVACTVLLGCATGDGEDGTPTTPPGDATSADTTPPSGDSSIFLVEDTAEPDDTNLGEDTAVAPETSEPVDSAPAPTTTTLTIDTLECRVITCPTSHPYVVGCNVTMGGASSIACAAHVPGTVRVTFKEGQSCGDITVRGTVECSTVPGTGLNATNCRMNKPSPLYVSFISACPT